MRLLVRSLIGLLVVLGVGLALVATLLPGIVESPETRALIAETSAEQIGRPLEFGGLSVGLLPPSIVVEAPRIAGETPDAEALFEADAISLRIALLPLLSLTVTVDSLLVDRARISLVRTPEGLLLPEPKPAPAAESASSDEAAPASPGAEPPIKLAVQTVAIRGARIRFEDRALAEPVEWRIEPLDLTLRGRGAGAPVAIEGRAELASGGAFDLSGQLDLDSLYLDLDVGLDGIALAQAAVYAGEGARLDATLSGGIAISGAASAPEKVTIELTLDADRIEVAGAVIEGPTALGAEVALAGAQPSGVFSLDASGARIDVPGSFAKAEGVVISAKGRFAQLASGAMRVDVEPLRIHALTAKLRAESDDTNRITIDAAPFDLAGWDALLPALPAGLLGGRVAIRGLTIQDAPLRLGGQIALEPALLSLAPGEPVGLRGVLEGRGAGLRLPGLDIDAGGQHVTLSGGVTELEGPMRFDFTLETKGVIRANPFVTALGGNSDTVYGPLAFDAKVAGALAGAAGDSALTDSLTGHVRFDLGRGAGSGDEGGRLDGVSVLHSVWEGFDHLGTTARVANVLTGGKVPDLEAYFGDEFERMDARMQITDGHLHTRRLRIVYRDYGVNLRGRVRLADQALDMTGELELGSALVEALGAEAEDGEVVIPLAQVGGSAAAPEFDVSDEAANALASALIARNPKVKQAVTKATEEADKYVPGASKALGDLFGR